MSTTTMQGMTSGRRAGAALAMTALMAAFPAAAREPQGLGLTETAQVAGRELKLTGSGISARMIFKIYAMALYLLDEKRSAEYVEDSDEPRRLVISMLRDISGEDFSKVVLDYATQNQRQIGAKAATQFLQIGQAIGSRPNGLRKGDTLTLDWVPGTGVVIELNRKPLVEPMRDIQFYNLLLGIWLGDKPADPELKSKLLHRPGPLRAAL